MRNIIRIFLSDARRIMTNVVAVVVVIGLSVIPCLYAWFNILSNWAPYDQAATSRLEVAVANSDTGTKLDGVELNIGDIIIDNLKQNKSIDWVFKKTAEDATEGVNSGDYYAALVIDQSFSSDMLSFIGGDINHPQIHYYENEKKNAIAPKITAQVKTTVQSEVNRAFVSTLTQGMLEVSRYATTSEDNAGVSTDLSGQAIERLQRMDTDLTTVTAIIDSYISMIDTVQNLETASAAVSQEMSDMIRSADAMQNSAEAAANAADSSLGTASDMVTVTLNQLENQMDLLHDTLSGALSDDQTSITLDTTQIAGIRQMVDAMKSQFDTALSNVDYNDNLKARISAIDADYNKLIDDSRSLEESADGAAADAADLCRRTTADLETCRTDLKGLFDSYMSAVRPSLSGTMDSVKNSLTEVSSLLNTSSSAVTDVASALGNYPDMMALGKTNLTDSRNQIADMQKQLEGLISDMQQLDSNDQYAMLMKMLETKPEKIADFISEPVDVKTDVVYGIANNGSATAPFYIVLSIWVGALILVAIIHTTIKNRSEFPKLRTYQEFFGRYLIFLAIGQIQTLITVLGALLYVGIQCRHPFLFWLACAFTSLAYTLLMYSLAYAFGVIGEAAAVILMVVQVAGSGGTFPVEVLPVIYQVLYKYMPFMYSMNAVRECIGGMHGQDYWMYMGEIGMVIVVSLVIGLVISIPCKRLNRKIDEAKASTGVMA